MLRCFLTSERSGVVKTFRYVPTVNEIESTIVPLDNCHTLLASFGIGGDNREYQRWRRDDGFRWVDLEDTLNTSEFVVGIDWREWLNDAVDTIAHQLSLIDVQLDVNLNDDGDRGAISVGSASADIKFVPADDDDFCAVVTAVNRLLGDRASYRKFNSCEDSDGYWFGLQTADQWNALDSSIPQTVKLIFKPDGT